MRIWSPEIPDEGKIPKKYVMPAAGGENLSPPLRWEGVPKEARSLVLICVDTHPVARNWMHWVVINIPPTVTELPEGASGKGLPAGARELVNSYGFTGYGGPQPPPGTGPHPYHFILYALDVERVNLPERPSFAEVERYLAGHILEKASFVGYYER
ncbi:YbhB/YbcL family Raf kinase inhibitor-like protein [Thermosulfurimonas sp. F29]|uniref:YbhB/YbcL family Raf kinase inhibitor-like protein n=1 Tax=Thermosulfurimonas sp. F29 TaxID=2867247 RepID=UPI001C8403F7|nr:YbhB/YbcL family Raf kinase inhibitor-like protein [Thermosulfurimonas sp. F29]MBX6422682.1 YbhB/YbcL family Raf kinase inhibitor-like protein [Thermosulfurimonas sp. F29]